MSLPWDCPAFTLKPHTDPYLLLNASIFSCAWMEVNLRGWQRLQGALFDLWGIRSNLEAQKKSFGQPRTLPKRHFSVPWTTLSFSAGCNVSTCELILWHWPKSFTYFSLLNTCWKEQSSPRKEFFWAVTGSLCGSKCVSFSHSNCRSCPIQTCVSTNHKAWQFS